MRRLTCWNAEQVLDNLPPRRLLPRGATRSTRAWLRSFISFTHASLAVLLCPDILLIGFTYRTSKRTMACLSGHAVSFLQSMCGSRGHGSLLPELLRYYHYFSSLCSFNFPSCCQKKKKPYPSTDHQCGPLATVTNCKCQLSVH
jgi:hypothetical protein